MITAWGQEKPQRCKFPESRNVTCVMVLARKPYHQHCPKVASHSRTVAADIIKTINNMAHLARKFADYLILMVLMGCIQGQVKNCRGPLKGNS